ncbi:secondary thiamine-phosphate synthase enzyme YjbQ [Aliiglaciecola sp. CAU 1673]|uniref:secondary thiamine-phosphate synthase enzyme YjbQ n=1 Tax=Aliiglaciecola sp. CAU 1673 TaxID=3032595 RepID=UPI0023DA9DB8|nr:secondary thiamine-phosphate synthase enzyme YjbQ [Aliiglaciecola sp. CAU 1673]MDF2179423.1 secondary thiamine-phosphate synthase enzyme YjbQ [Aliiglaciecola sp. CAU 1673]
MWQQRKIQLKARPRGFHLISEEVISQLPELRNIRIGMLNLFIQHTSASLTINENADPTVRRDFESHFNVLVPENAAYYQHTFEGSDDMPAHLKSSLLGASLMIPISDGQLALGTWQGVYLCEHRNQGGVRTLVATIMGESYSDRK